MRVSVIGAAALMVACGGAPKPAPEPRAEAPAATATAAERIASSYGGPRIRVAVGRFDELAAATQLFEAMGWKGVSGLLTEQIATALVNSGRVTVLERAQIGNVIGNTKLEKEGDLSKYFDQKSTVDSGKLQGAQVMLVGSVIRFEPNVSGGGGGIEIPMLGSLKYHEDKAIVGINVRLVDAESGKVLCAAEGEGTIVTQGFGGQGSYQGVSMGADTWSRTPLGAATRAAGDDALAKLLVGVKQISWEASVTQVMSPEKVFIQAGEDLNLKAGDRFRVVHRGEAIKDPEGQIIGYDETVGGLIELVSVQPKMSIAKIAEGNPPKAGDKVRLPSP